MDFEVMYQAMDSRDARFDGRFFVAVKTTGIYCRPVCPAPTPKRHNTRFFRYAAVAELAGFRPCRRCRPEASPDTAEWDTRADLVGRGLRLIADGVVDTLGVRGLADRLSVSERHLQRVFAAQVGATPGVIARSRRARLAKQLLTETTLPITGVAFASGFSSVRAFNETIQRIYRITPTELRRGRATEKAALRFELRYRRPLAVPELMDFLRARAIPGVEEVTAMTYRRAIRFGRRGAVIELRPGNGAFVMSIESDEIDHIAPVVQRARRLLDLDADPELIDAHLARSAALQPLVAARSGLRLPGSYDPFETVVRIALQRGSSPGAAARIAGRIAAELGSPIGAPSGSITHTFPGPHQLAGADLTVLGLSARRARTLAAIAEAVARGEIPVDGSGDVTTAVARLRAVPGIGEATCRLVRLHVLRDPDAPLPRDGPVARFLAKEGADPETWRPWRGYAAMHLQRWAAAPALAESAGS